MEHSTFCLIIIPFTALSTTLSAALFAREIKHIVKHAFFSGFMLQDENLLLCVCCEAMVAHAEVSDLKTLMEHHKR